MIPTASPIETSASVVLVLRIVSKAEETDKLAVDENGKDVEEAEVGVPSPAVHHTQGTFWKRVAVGSLSLRDASPGSESSPFNAWSVLGSPPPRAFHLCPLAGGH